MPLEVPAHVDPIRIPRQLPIATGEAVSEPDPENVLQSEDICTRHLDLILKVAFVTCTHARAADSLAAYQTVLSEFGRSKPR
jgi:hypothetical protein